VRPVRADVVTQAIASTSPEATFAWMRSKSIMRGRLSHSGAGSRMLRRRTPGSLSSWPAYLRTSSGPVRRRIGRMTSDLRSARHVSTTVSACSSTGRCWEAASAPAFSAPTLVPTKMVGLSPRRSSSGRMTDSAPAS
jgi:hypothetical protein